MVSVTVKTAKVSQEPVGLVRVDKPLPRIGSLLATVTRGDPEMVEEVLRLSRQDEHAFLAWQAVRKGNRAGLLVGDIGCRGQALPYTGFEGYWAHAGLSPREIVSAEARLGREILAAMRHHLATSRPGEPGHSTVLAALWATLRGESYSQAMLRLLHTHFGAALGKLRAQETMQTGWYDAFKDATYASLQLPLTYTCEQGVLCEHYALPLWANRGTLPPTSVGLTDAELECYLVTAEIGRIGHPLLRGILHRGG